MKLTKVILVNWFLYKPQEIQFYGNVAIIGENGAGKSTIIDAIQTVLFGGNQRYIKLNASSSESRSERDIKSYCLGYFRPDDGSGNSRNFRKRDECISYIGLVFHNEVIDTYVNLFVGIEARADEQKVDFKMRGMVECNRPLNVEDFIYVESDKSYRVHPFDIVKQRLSISGVEAHYENNSAKFLNEMVRLIGPRKELNQWIDPEVLRDSLSKSISLKEVKDISRFVESFILEAKPIDINSLVNAKNKYEEIEAQIKTCEQQINDLEDIAKNARSYERLLKKSNYLGWLIQEKKVESLYSEVDDLREQIKDKVKDYVNACRSFRKLNSEIPAKEKYRDNLQAQIQDDDLARQQKRLEDDIEKLQEDLGVQGQKLLKIRNLFKTLCDANVEIIRDQTFKGWVQELSPLIDKAESRTKVDELISKIVDKLPEIQFLLKRQKKTTYSDLANAEKEVEKYQGYIQSVSSSGKTPLSRPTQNLIMHLAEHGIKAEPICHITECLDENWQPAIEAFLGKEVEALIVPVDLERKAIQLYRQYKKEHKLFGSTVVKVSRAQDWLHKFKENTAATLVHSDNDLALAYLHKRLGNLELVDSEEELKHSNFAITQDGMTATATGISSKKLFPDLKLVKDQSENLRIWKYERDQNAEKVLRLTKDGEGLETIDTSLASIQSYEKESGTLLTQKIAQKIQSIESNISIKSNNLDRLDLSHLEDLKSELEVLKIHITESIEAKGVHKKVKSEGLRTARYLSEKIDDLEKQVDSLLKAQRDIEDDEFFDVQLNDEFQQAHEEDTVEMLESSRTSAEKSASSKQADTTHLIDAYASRNTEFDTGDITPLNKTFLHRAMELVQIHIDSIHEMNLVPYREASEKARADISETFRKDVLNRLKEAFGFQAQQFNSINRALENKEFHSEIYRFTKSAKKEFKLLIDYINSSSPEALSTSSNDLFDQMPEEVKEQIDLLVEAGQENASDIQDYRKYFTYDVLVTNHKTGNKTKLSNLLKTGSGGEKQSPFYVAIAASLANAWRTLNSNGGSAGLALLDEAFNRLDEANLHSAIEFMNDTGLQVIVATPASKEQVFKEAVDSTIYISKYALGGTEEVDVDIEILTDKAKALLAKSNPAFTE
ncbi:hypothetical protein J3998_07885 [Thiomicrorhabdus sp. 6S2-11]|uniref:AAA family ATPase n=1 Tax=Thiomicrorhabdus marina TaxID=2818442 RepID=A0ABS3Q5D5_9GAMM|nr:SbcC/MukB-like Walker B domain-containing protein [Thiomicrorhabdus marina]MBO1927496.1 hypothetical protein [Thiomicrorhabdus marina]